MLVKLLLVMMMFVGCGIHNASGEFEEDLGYLDDMGDSEGSAATVWTLPKPRFDREDYLDLAQRLCVDGGDRGKKVFSIQTRAYHPPAVALAFRNGAGQFLFVNQACEAWILISRGQGLGNSYLEFPAYKRFTTEQFATLLENYRVLEFRDFEQTGLTREFFSNMLLFEVDGVHLALGLDYATEYVDQKTGIPFDSAKGVEFTENELLAMAILHYSFWEDSDLLSSLEPYEGERLWFTTALERGPDFFPSRLVQDWPFQVGPEDMGVVTYQGCSDFWYLTGDEADKFRELRDRMLAMEPKDSYGHWAVPMKWGDKTYLVEMAEGFPLEDDEGFIPWMDLRMVYFDCSDL